MNLDLNIYIILCKFSFDRIVGGTEVKQDAKYPYQIWVQVTFIIDFAGSESYKYCRAWGPVVALSSTRGTY